MAKYLRRAFVIAIIAAYAWASNDDYKHEQTRTAYSECAQGCGEEVAHANPH